MSAATSCDPASSTSLAWRSMRASTESGGHVAVSVHVSSELQAVAIVAVRSATAAGIWLRRSESMPELACRVGGPGVKRDLRLAIRSPALGTVWLLTTTPHISAVPNHTFL